MSLFKKQIVVIGSHSCSKELRKTAYDVGKEIARNGYILLCGGKEGVMEAACRGAKDNNGLTVGIIPEFHPDGGNKYLDIIIPSGINFSRNYIVQNSGDAIIMLGGSYGTLSELAYALQFGRKVIALKSKWSKISKNIVIAKNAKEAVEKAIKLCRGTK